MFYVIFDENDVPLKIVDHESSAPRKSVPIADLLDEIRRGEFDDVPGINSLLVSGTDSKGMRITIAKVPREFMNEEELKLLRSQKIQFAKQGEQWKIGKTLGELEKPDSA